MTHKNGFMSDLSSEAQSRRAKQNRGKTPWRCGPICQTRKAHDKFEQDNVKIDLRVAGSTRPLRTTRKQD